MNEDLGSIYNNPNLNYSNRTLVGEWFENMSQKQYISKLMAHKHVKGTLEIQKLRKLYNNFLAERKLAPDTPLIEYGEHYQLENEDVPINFDSIKCFGLYLSCVVDIKTSTYCQDVNEDCFLTASPFKASSVRNSFQIVSDNPGLNKNGYRVLCGENVCIQMRSPGGTPYYVTCNNSSYRNFGRPMPVTLTRHIDSYCKFRLFHHNESKVHDTLGNPIPINSKLVIQHSASGQHIVCEDQWIHTIFGPERQITVRLARDSKRKLLPMSFWNIVGQSKYDITLTMRASRGDYIPEALLE